MDPKHSIPAFYAGRSIFITGATGFMGKVLIEKLLWSCPDVKEIFLLIRPKKNVNIDDRMKQMLSLPLFDRLRNNRPEAFEKLIPVMGDTVSEGLGLPDIERQFLIERVSIVFHVAASVRFNDPLKAAIIINTRATRDVCILAANMKKLVALMHVSTTYSQTDKHTVEEELYPFPVDWKQAIKVAETFDDFTLKKLTAKYLDNFPNTYTFTKRLAESVMASYEGILPITVFRPSIVISSINDPMEGWLDNFNGPVGLMAGGGKGVLRTVYLDPQIIADFVPVDIAIKVMITATWKRGLITITQDPKVHVYNCSSADIKSISTVEIVKMGLQYNAKFPLEDTMWKPDCTVTKHKSVYFVLTLLLHVLPGILIDTALRLSNRKPILLKLQRKVYVVNVALQYFLTHQWKFKNEKVLKLLDETPPNDLKSFGFEYATFDIYKYFENCLVGAKIYLFKEDMSKIDEAKVHYNRMYWLDVIVKVLCAVVFGWLIYRFSVVSWLENLIVTAMKF